MTAGRAEESENFWPRYKRPEGDIHTEASEAVRRFSCGVCQRSCNSELHEYTGPTTKRRWELTGVLPAGSRRFSRARMANGGEVALQETGMPNKDRKPPAGASDHFDDYVGHYRFGENGDKGEVSITRVGDKLYDTWADEEATELLPGHVRHVLHPRRWLDREVRSR